jgi:RNA polymerase sigma factor (TIGR02999 family)
MSHSNHDANNHEVTRILSANSSHAAEELLPLVYEELRRMAAARMAQENSGHTLQPTALVHDAWVRLSGGAGQKWVNRAHFFAAAAESMRRILIEYARKKSALKRGGHMVRVEMENLDVAAASPDEMVLLVAEALERFKAEDPEKAKIVVMKFFGGLTNEEVAQSLGVVERTVERQWAYAKAWLYRDIRKQSPTSGEAHPAPVVVPKRHA